MFNKGDKIVVKQWGGKYRPAVFLSYRKNDSTFCNVKYVSKDYVITVPVEMVLSMDVYLSPLFEAMREED